MRKTSVIIGAALLLSLPLTVHLLPSKGIRAADMSFKEPIGTNPIPIIILWLTGVTTVGLGRTMLRRLSMSQQIIVSSDRASRKRVMLLGAGPQAANIIRGIYEDPQLRYDIVGILDNRQAQGTYVHNVRVIGPVGMIHRLLAEQAVDKVIVAIPDAGVSEMREAVIECRRQKLPVKVVPRLSEILVGKRAFRLEDFSVEDFLLRRAPLCSDLTETSKCITGKRVLATGAGGSIGSEVCRQIASFDPECLVLPGHGENSVFHIHNELLMDFPHLADRLHWVIASIADEHCDS